MALETLHSLDGWPVVEWPARLAELTQARTSPDGMAHIKRTAGPLLAEELDRWR